METLLATWATGRQLFEKFFEDYTLDQLNKVPEGFNNNIIWNVGHVIVAQQGIYYKGAGLDYYIDDALFAKYAKGTKPEAPATQEVVDHLMFLLNDLVVKTKKDVADGVFKTYNPRQTATGFYLGSFEEAAYFNNYHEALHLGVMMSIRKFV